MSDRIPPGGKATVQTAKAYDPDEADRNAAWLSRLYAVGFLPPIGMPREQIDAELARREAAQGGSVGLGPTVPDPRYVGAPTQGAVIPPPANVAQAYDGKEAKRDAEWLDRLRAVDFLPAIGMSRQEIDAELERREKAK